MRTEIRCGTNISIRNLPCLALSCDFNSEKKVFGGKLGTVQYAVTFETVPRGTETRWVQMVADKGANGWAELGSNGNACQKFRRRPTPPCHASATNLSDERGRERVRD